MLMLVVVWVESIDCFSTNRVIRRPSVSYELTCLPFTFNDVKIDLAEVLVVTKSHI